MDASNKVAHNGFDGNAEFIRYDMISPLTHMELADEETRIRRAPKSGFDIGYEEFLRNYHSDNIRDTDKQKYKVHESNQDEVDDRSFKSDEDEDDDDDNDSDGDDDEDDSGDDDDDDGDDDEDDDESGENRKRYKPKSKSKSHKHKKKDDKKKSKNCKTVKRGNMVCNVCKNSKNDGKLESCSTSESPKSNNYEYSEDSSYKKLNKDPEGIDDGEGEKAIDDDPVKRPHPPPLPKYPTNRPYGPKYYPAPPPRPYRPPVYRQSRPIYRVQIKNPPSDVTVLRLRTTDAPYQRIRLVPLPSRLEVRPPRDIHSSPSETSISNYTKDYLFSLPPLIPLLRPSPLPPVRPSPVPPVRPTTAAPNDKSYAVFVRKDGAKCKKFFELSEVCIECYLKGERQKECMSSKKTRPENVYKSYSTSKKVHKDEPYEFEQPQPPVTEHSKHHSHSTETRLRHFNSKRPPFNGQVLVPGSLNGAGFGYYNPYGPPQSLPPLLSHTLPQPLPLQPPNYGNLMYGNVRPKPEPVALFYHSGGGTHDSLVVHNNNAHAEANAAVQKTNSNQDVMKSSENSSEMSSAKPTSSSETTTTNTSSNGANVMT